MLDSDSSPRAAKVATPKLMASSLRNQALRVIRAQIVSGELKPGELYALGTIAEELGVSVTPVREAVLDLAKEGLVELSRNRGFQVRAMTDEDLDEIVELRRMIEPAAVREIASKQMLEKADEVRELAEKTERYAADGDWVAFLDSDREFHMRILASLGNDRLLEIVGTLRDQSRLYGLERVAGSEKLMASTREHKELLDAIIRGDGDDAERITDNHLRHVRGIWAAPLAP